ncbi:MAG: ADOP family duplicated permease [Bryobacteraceae bacterium]
MWRDFVRGFRILRTQRTFACVSILTLALAAGATTAVFAAVEAVLLHPLPFRDADRLVAIWGRHRTQPGFSRVFDTWADFHRWRDSAHAFAAIGVATWARGGETMTGRGPARSVLSIPVSAEFFPMLGVSAAKGRVFDHADLSRGCSVVAAHRFWRDVLGGDPAIAGQSLVLSGKSCTVIGVMPEEFVFYPAATELWMLAMPDRPAETAAGVFARLRDGVSVEAAERELLELHERDRSTLPRDRLDIVPAVYPLRDEFTCLTSRSLRATMVALAAAVVALLAIACANIASLQVGRMLARQREIAIRAALGSGRRRLVSQLLAESLAIVALGIATGFALAIVAVRLFNWWRPVELPPGVTLAVSWPVLTFSAAVIAFATLVFSLLPVWHASRANLEGLLRTRVTGAPGAGRIRSALVTAEVALSLALCAIAGLLVESTLRLHASTGIDLEHIASFRVSAARPPVLESIRERVDALPGVEAAALTSHLPLTGFPASPVEVEGRPVAEPLIDTLDQTVSESYFRVMAIPLLRGRGLGRTDVKGAPPVALVNQAFADRHFPGEDPAGRRFRYAHRQGASQPWVEIVGVVGDDTRAQLDEMSWVRPPIAYRAAAQSDAGAPHIVVRAASLDWARSVPGIMTELAPDAPLGEVTRMSRVRDQQLAYPHFRAAMVFAFGLVALALAAAGVFAVISHHAAGRMREFGIRIALGAEPRNVLAILLRQGMALLCVGSAAGLLLAWWASSAAASLLATAVRFDPVRACALSLVPIAAGVAAILVPALRASRRDPMAALRAD